MNGSFETIQFIRRGRIMVMLRVALICLICILAQPIHVSAETQNEHPSYAITVYSGVMTDDTWRRSITGKADLIDSYIVTGAASWTFYRPRNNWFSLELETSISQHFGTSHNLEFCFPIVTFRWEYFPWDNYVDTSVATGYGFSFATEIPQAEIDLDGSSEQLLLYFHYEAEFALPDSPWALALRLHHRSPSYGLFGDNGWSNFLTAGLRYSF